jgi:hypothetical protein
MRKLLLLFSCAMTASVLAAEPDMRIAGFAAMQNGDTITANYSRIGCFDFAHYEFTFRKASNVTAVTLATLSPNPSDSGETNRTVTAILELSAADIAGLDKLLQLYRAPRNGASFTTTIQISFIQKRGPTIVAEEHIVDKTGATFYPLNQQKLDFTSFGDLINRTFPEKERAAYLDFFQRSAFGFMWLASASRP